jgi:4-amino-4-deoxy-L-arabinose transferase-like glycosyltransferase
MPRSPAETTVAARVRGGRRILLAAILVVAAALRFAHLGRLSLWYDEVVSMRLARQPDPSALIRLLFQIDATRAPLHPLVLQGWLRLFGPSDYAGRSLSAVCGLLTVALTYRIGRRLFDDATALWGAGLATISPLLVRYSQEVRMYAWLVLLTCLAWDLLLSFRQSASAWRQAAFALVLVGLVYSHPLGTFMVAALALAYLANVRAFQLSWGRWLAIQFLVVMAVAPWVGHYLDHPPEVISGTVSLRDLLGLPIGFTGGDSRFLLICGAVIAWGLLDLGRPGSSEGFRVRLGDPFAASVLLIWFAVPPLLLFAHSLVGHPIFGQARYTLFVGPAYLLLLARGITRLPRQARWAFALAVAGLAGLLMENMVYAPDLKADWRSAARSILRWPPRPVVIVFSGDPAQNVEIETARYYLGPGAVVISSAEALAHPPAGEQEEGGPSAIFFAIGERDGNLIAAVPDELKRLYHPYGREDLRGLRLLRCWKDVTRPREATRRRPD